MKMKKLMIAISAVVLGFAANAAALSWSTWGYTGDDPDAEGALLDGSMAYLVMVSDTSNFKVNDDLSVTGGSIIDSAGFEEGVAAGLWNAPDGALSGGSKYYFAVIATTDGSGSSVPTTGLYGVDSNGGNATGSGFYEVTWNADTGASLACDWDNYGGVAANTAVAPEPTSGLLLLLGMAGLVLKRKRA